MFTCGPKVDVHAQPRVEGIAGLRNQSLGKLSLELAGGQSGLGVWMDGWIVGLIATHHEHGDAWRVRHGQHLEDEGTADLVRGVGDEGVARGNLGHLDDVAQDDFELLGQGRALYTLGDFGAHSRIEFDWRAGQLGAIVGWVRRAVLAMTFFAFSSARTVTVGQRERQLPS